MLILAMVSIKLVWDGGIIAHTQNAVNNYNEAQTNELEQLNILEDQMRQYGEISTWWKKAESEELLKTEGGYIVATDGKTKSVVLGIDEENDSEIGLLIMIDERGYYYFLDDEFMKIMQNQHNELYKDENSVNTTRITFKKYKWYTTTDGSHFSDGVEYKGKSPISKEDFQIESGKIYSESYLQKVIDSFN